MVDEFSNNQDKRKPKYRQAKPHARYDMIGVLLRRIPRRIIDFLKYPIGQRCCVVQSVCKE